MGKTPKLATQREDLDIFQSRLRTFHWPSEDRGLALYGVEVCRKQK